MQENLEGPIETVSTDQEAASPLARSPSADMAYQLRFELLRQISTMSFLAVGGAITLLQTTLSDRPLTTSAVISLGFLIGAALTALSAQTYLVERLGEQVDGAKREYLIPPLIPRTRKLERILQQAAGVQLGLGLGMFAAYAAGAL